MDTRTKSEQFCDIAMSVIPVAGAVYHGRKGHKEGFLEASEIYEKKYQSLVDEKRQIRRDVFGEEQVLICPQSWDDDFWQKKMEIFIKERVEGDIEPRRLLVDFLGFCIDTFPQRRLAETLNDIRVVRDVIGATPAELRSKNQDDIELAIDFLRFYKDFGDIKKLKDELVALLPGTNGCNFLVLGKTGVGKSSLLNSLLGVKRFETGTGRPVTEKGVFESEGEIDGIKVRVFDSWGLEAGEVDQWRRILKDVQEKHDLSHKIEDWFHAVVYCISAGGSRVEDVDIYILRSMLPDDLYVVVALTKSDQCSVEDAEELRKTLVHDCENLLPENVIETCVGGETRTGKTEPFGIDELKRAIFANYKKTIRAQLPSRCIYLAKKEIDSFKKDTEAWIKTREWKYDENENNRPLRSKCDEFVASFLKNKFPEILRSELEASVKYSRNLATVLHFDDIESVMPNVPADMGFWEAVGSWFVKTFHFFFDPFGKTNKEEEHDRLKAKLEKFCAKMEAEVDKQRPAIENKVKEVLK